MKITPIPTGTKDIMPAEAAEIRFLEGSIRAAFDSFGYGEVVTPTLELESSLEAAGESRFRRSFRLFDERGDVMVLRPEMTTPIARLVATKMADSEPPFRLSYFANSFRPTRPQRGRQSEFYQAGLELIGVDSPAVDAEVLAVACQALAACGLEDFYIVLGEVSFFTALLDNIGISQTQKADVFAALADRDLVRLEEVTGALDISDKDRRDIMDVVLLRGGTDVLKAAGDLARDEKMAEALKRLARTYYLVSCYGFAGRILFDMGIMRNFDYYTGIVFEIVSGDLGFPLGGGGRYDGLLARFGRPEPAVGFAVGLDRLHIAVTEQGGASPPEKTAVALAGGLDLQLGLAVELRGQGIKVLALDADTPIDKAGRQARDAGIHLLATPQDGGYRLTDLDSGNAAVMARDKLIEKLTATAGKAATAGKTSAGKA